MSNAEFVGKILVVNGEFYAGVGKEFSDKRSEAVVIGNQRALNVLLDIVIHRVIYEGFKLKRIEILDVKEVNQ